MEDTTFGQLSAPQNTFYVLRDINCTSATPWQSGVKVVAPQKSAVNKYVCMQQKKKRSIINASHYRFAIQI